MLGQMPGVGNPPVFQARQPPPALVQQVQVGVPVNTGNIGGASGDSSASGGKPVRRSTVNSGTGQTSKGTSLIRLYLIVLNAPARGDVVLLSFDVKATPTSSDASSMTVDIQTASDAAFTTSVSTTTVTGKASGVMFTQQIGPFTDNTTLWLRVRSGNGTLWSDWTSPTSLWVRSLSGAASEFVYENIGLLLVDIGYGNEYVYENVGLPLIDTGYGNEYIYEGDVDTSAPTPWLWTIVPSSGRSGDGIKIYGHGMGATQPTYSGVVQMYISGAWTPVSVTSWTLVAATANALTNARQISPSLGIVDPEHGEVEFAIPIAANPPGHTVKVVTTT